MTPVDQVTIPLAAGRSASLPKSKGKKKTLLEKFPDLKFVVRDFYQFFEKSREKGQLFSTEAQLRNFFDHFLRGRRSECERAGTRNALPLKVSAWWFRKIRAAMGIQRRSVEKMK